jgi:hypothetical protein
VRRVETDEGLRPDLPRWAQREEIKALLTEVYELRRAHEIQTGWRDERATPVSVRCGSDGNGCSVLDQIGPRVLYRPYDVARALDRIDDRVTQIDK